MRLSLLRNIKIAGFLFIFGAIELTADQLDISKFPSEVAKVQLTECLLKWKFRTSDTCRQTSHSCSYFNMYSFTLEYNENR